LHVSNRKPASNRAVFTGDLPGSNPRLWSDDGQLSPYSRGTALIIDRWHGGHREKGVQDAAAGLERRISIVCSSFFGPIVLTGK
jgi:hypothetical protein